MTKPRYIMSNNYVEEIGKGTRLPNKQQVLDYLRGFEATWRAGTEAYDVITGCRIATMLEAFTDGEWAWDTEIIYYFDRYDAKLDPVFLRKFEKDVE